MLTHTSLGAGTDTVETVYTVNAGHSTAGQLCIEHRSASLKGTKAAECIMRATIPWRSNIVRPYMQDATPAH
jgi:hypothetical protein